MINFFQRYWIISLICFFYLWKLMFSSSFSFKNLLFFNSIFSCFFSFQITNICFYFLLFHIFQNLYSSKKENLFLSCNEKNVLPIFKNSKKNFWKSKKCTFIQVNFSLNENIYSIFRTFYLILLFLWNSFFIFAQFVLEYSFYIPTFNWILL